MKNKTLTLSLLALSVMAPATTAYAAVDASSQTVPSPEVIGGSISPQLDWAVQLEATKADKPGYVFNCTGEQLNSEWILSARHCIDGINHMDVFFSNDRQNRGPATQADQIISAPAGDIALIHLSQDHHSTEYAPLTHERYEPTVGDMGTLYGYGLRANQAQADRLYQANVEVIGESTDAYGGPAVHVRGVDGASNHGDSGGPLLVNGQLVAIDSTGDGGDKLDNIHASSNYANLSDQLSWIESTTGLSQPTGNPTDEPTGNPYGETLNDY